MPRDPRVWQHNSFIGSACMMQKQAQSIIRSRTASPPAKRLAKDILDLAFELENALRAERMDSKDAR